MSALPQALNRPEELCRWARQIPRHRLFSHQLAVDPRQLIGTDCEHSRRRRNTLQPMRAEVDQRHTIRQMSQQIGCGF